jgi:hypothetical protein
MSIQDRCDDAEFLWKAGRKHGALISVLVGIAAASKRRYPDIKEDRKSFEKFVVDETPCRLSANFRGDMYSAETMIYKWFRCELIHSAGLPPDLVMVEGESGVLSLRAGGGNSEYL